jgi:molybdate transport system substrate-binding protein
VRAPIADDQASGVTLLFILSSGGGMAAVRALAREFARAPGARVDARFDAAGAIRSAFEQDRDADLVILPDAMLEALAASNRVDRSTFAPLGVVATGVAVREGDVSPCIGDADALRDALVAAPALYCPDTVRSTAGGHFMRVLTMLGIDKSSKAKLRAYANGAAAMAELAQERRAGALGCTQVTEIRYTPGVTLVAALPAPFELSTRYALAVATDAPSRELARAFAARLAGEEATRLRRDGGFDV